MEVTIQNWIYEFNLKPFLETIATLCGYDWIDGELENLIHNGMDTDVEKAIWYSYKLHGEFEVELKIAADSGSSAVHIRLVGAPESIPKFELLFLVTQTYRLEAR